MSMSLPVCVCRCATCLMVLPQLAFLMDLFFYVLQQNTFEQRTFLLLFFFFFIKTLSFERLAFVVLYRNIDKMFYCESP